MVIGLKNFFAALIIYTAVQFTVQSTRLRMMTTSPFIHVQPSSRYLSTTANWSTPSPTTPTHINSKHYMHQRRWHSFTQFTTFLRLFVSPYSNASFLNLQHDPRQTEALSIKVPNEISTKGTIVYSTVLVAPTVSNKTTSSIAPLSTTVSTVIAITVSNTTVSIEEAYTGYTLQQKVLIGVAMGLLSIMTITGNIFVLIAFLSAKHLRTITNYFVLSLAASDFLIGLFSINFYAIYVIMGKWPFGPIVCDAWLCMDYVCCQASVLNLVIISIDRYLSLTHPLQYRARRTGRKARVVISLIWIVSFLLWAPGIVLFQFIQGERTVPDTDCYIQFLYESWYITIITAIAAYYAPILLMIFLYSKIYLLIQGRKARLQSMTNSEKKSSKGSIDIGKRASEDMSGGHIVIANMRIEAVDFRNNWKYEITKPKSTNSELDQSTVNRNRHKAAKMLSLVTLAYVITWFPYDLFAVMAPFCEQCISIDWWHFGYIFCYVNSTINPFCYAFGNNNFKTAFQDLLCKNGDKESEPQTRMQSIDEE